MSFYKLLIFDFDGTLIDSKRDIAIATNHTLAAFGIPPLDEETIAGYVGSGMAELLKGAMKAGSNHPNQRHGRGEGGKSESFWLKQRRSTKVTPPNNPLRVVCPSALLMEGATLAPLMDIFKNFYGEHCADNTRWYPHVLETLKRLSKKYRLTILTNKPKNLTDIIINKLGGGSLFSQVIGMHEGFEKKPDPSGALHLMATAKISCDQTLLVGDSIVDVQTAQNAGIDVGLVTYGFGKADEIGGASTVFCIDLFSTLVDFLL